MHPLTCVVVAHSKVTFTDMVPADANDPDPGGVLHASVDASWKSSWARHSDVPILAKCVRLGLLVSLLARFHGPPCSRTTRRHCLARQFSRPKRYASCRGAYSLHGHLYGHTCHSSCFTRVAHMCHDMTGPAIMAGRLGARTFCLPLAGIACHGLIA